MLSNKAPRGGVEHGLVGPCEVIDAAELATRWNLPESWIRSKRAPGLATHCPVSGLGAMFGSSGIRRSSRPGTRAGAASRYPASVCKIALTSNIALR